MSRTILVSVIVFSTVCTVVSQLSLKAGLNQIGVDAFSLSLVRDLWLKLLTNVYVLGWFVLALLAMFSWVWALAYLDLSFAYPFLSIGYILIVLLSAVFLKESISLIRWAGALLICAGLLLIYRS